MKKTATAICVSICLAACGGSGGGSSSLTPTPKSLKLSLYGQPLVAAGGAVTHAQLVARDSAASTPTTSSDAGTSVQSLQDALVARGVPAAVTAQVMDGTTLHQIVIGENNGLPPTPDQFKTDPSEWIVVNFQLDDMISTVDVPTQAAAIQQFIEDLSVFVQRAAVSGKQVFAVQPIQTCDAKPGFSASYGLQYALTQASLKSNLSIIGAIPLTVAYDGFGNVIQTADLAHLGADCRTPDAYLLNERVQAIADNIAKRYQATVSGTN